MRKIKLTVQCRVPSWNFCNLDEYTSDGRYSKKLCRYCITTKQGHHCMLHDVDLNSDSKFVYKPEACIDATAGFAITADEQEAPRVDAKLVMQETLKAYKKNLETLVRQGYPRAMAENVAAQMTMKGI